MLWNKKYSNLDYFFVDMHSHIIPNVDDGANSLDESMKMIKIAYEDGIRTMLATPHYHPIRGKESAEMILKNYYDLRQKVDDEYSDMNLFLGREVYYTTETAENLQNNRLLCLNDTHYVLVEYSSSVNSDYIIRSVNDIVNHGYVPIIAHIERYSCTQRNLSFIPEIKDMGAIIQVNVDSIMGESGIEMKKTCKKLLQNFFVDVIGTDAHNSGSRSPKIKKCAIYLSKKYNENYVYDLLNGNANKILQGKFLEEID